MCVYIRCLFMWPNKTQQIAGIPVEKELVPSIQTNDYHDLDGDIESFIVTSKIHSKESTRFGSTQQITTTFGRY